MTGRAGMDADERFVASIKLRQVQYFLAVAESLHFTRAASSLSVTQPTLSHQIAELESQIGTKLFDRVGKTVRLTEAGEAFAGHARAALRELQAGRVALEELRGLVRGSLRIGVIQSFSRTLLPPILGRFIAAHPGIRPLVEEMAAPAIERALAAGRLDIGIAFAPGALAQTEIEPVLQEAMLLVVGRRHRLARRGTLRLAELDGERLALLSREFTTRQLIDRYLDSVGARPELVCETNSIEVILGTVSEGALAAILPERAIGRRGPGLATVRLVEPTPVRVSALMWARHSHRTAAALSFAAQVRAHFLAGLG